jgi:arabinose-5-phosphate isomerase
MSVPMTNAPHKLIASALRTLEAEASGISALTAAMQNGLGDSFTAAVNLISKARGRVIITGMGKSGHVGRKIAATLASTARCLFRPSQRSEPRRPRHDHDR